MQKHILIFTKTRTISKIYRECAKSFVFLSIHLKKLNIAFKKLFKLLRQCVSISFLDSIGQSRYLTSNIDQRSTFFHFKIRQKKSQTTRASSITDLFLSLRPPFPLRFVTPGAWSARLQVYLSLFSSRLDRLGFLRHEPGTDKENLPILAQNFSDFRKVFSLLKQLSIELTLFNYLNNILQDKNKNHS